MRVLRFAPLAAVLLVACSPKAVTDKPLVVASFYPAAYLASAIGGEHVEVLQATPPGMEPHDYEPSAAQMARLLQASALVYNGGGVDAWAEHVASSLRAEGAPVVALTEGVRLLPAGEHTHDHDEAGHDEHGHEEEGQDDPHIWLDPVLLAAQIDRVRDMLIAADGAHAAAYAANADALRRRLEALDERFTAGLARCDLRTVIVSHNAFQYLGNRYNLTMESIAGLSPEEEPSAARMVELTEHAREHGIDVVFFETLVSSKVAQAIADEVGARTMVLNPVEGLTLQETEAGVTYEGVMEQNLEALRTALRCS